MNFGGEQQATSQPGQVIWLHVGLSSDGDWLIEEHSRITVGLLVCSLRILPLLNWPAAYVLEWRFDLASSYVERANRQAEETFWMSVRPLFIARREKRDCSNLRHREW